MPELRQHRGMHSAQREVAKKLKDPGTSAEILHNHMNINNKLLHCTIAVVS